jgi:hypothetical protein
MLGHLFLRMQKGAIGKQNAIAIQNETLRGAVGRDAIWA